MSISLLNRLAAYWPLTELSGTRFDSSPNKNNLAVTGSILSALDPLKGVGAIFDGNAANFLSVADTSKLRMGNTDFSVSAFVRLDSIVNCDFVTKGANEPNGFDWLIGQAAGAGFYFNIYATGISTPTSGLIGTNPGPSAGVWYHLCARKAANGGQRLQVNASAFSDQVGPATGGNPKSVSRFALGCRVLGGTGVANTTPINGVIRQVGVWNRYLDDIEVPLLYGGGFGLSAAQEAEIARGF